MERTVFAVINGGSFMGSTVLTKTSIEASSDGFPSFSYLQQNMHVLKDKRNSRILSNDQQKKEFSKTACKKEKERGRSGRG